MVVGRANGLACGIPAGTTTKNTRLGEGFVEGGSGVEGSVSGGWWRGGRGGWPGRVGGRVRGPRGGAPPRRSGR